MTPRGAFESHAAAMTRASSAGRAVESAGPDAGSCLLILMAKDEEQQQRDPEAAGELPECRSLIGGEHGVAGEEGGASGESGSGIGQAA